MFPEPAVRNGRKPERRTARARGKASRSSTRMPLTQRARKRTRLLAGQKTPSGSRQSQSYSARNVLPLQPLGAIPSLGLLLFARYEGAQYTLVAVNTTGNEQTVPFWFPVGGDYREELHGGDLDLEGVPALQEHALTIPSHYGRIWTKSCKLVQTRTQVSRLRVSHQAIALSGRTQRKTQKSWGGPAGLERAGGPRLNVDRIS